MLNQKLLEYIKQEVQIGADREEVTKVLVNNGWKLEDIIEAFGTAEALIKEEKHLENIENEIDSETLAE